MVPPKGTSPFLGNSANYGGGVAFGTLNSCIVCFNTDEARLVENY